ncbi:MAG: hypothetical protein A3J63_03255 [Candidatus Moranbacteria bacterium RIFCSPHIGHO2_02_FULL_40_12b]|nr:MAG: hypothetical protein A3J63_03255 [Candidatus Moranbacteria bacterium RIFCSPHIGHO2_02_FULL_40_12b]
MPPLKRSRRESKICPLPPLPLEIEGVKPISLLNFIPRHLRFGGKPALEADKQCSNNFGIGRTAIP